MFRLRFGALALLLSVGCYASRELASAPHSLDDAGTRPDVRILPFPPDRDAGAAEDAGRGCDAGPDPVLEGPPLLVDLLFVVDDSGSMAEEQAALADQFPSLVRTLATGDLDGDGRGDVQPVDDLRVGVLTTNLGAPGVDPGAIGGCEVRPGDGSGGVLRSQLRGPGCAGAVPGFLAFVPGSGADADAFAADFACLAVVGDDGCGFEQPLEATLKALLPADGPVRFLEGVGQGDGANAGFVREGAVLAVVLVTDEDDCSVADPELFDLESERFPGGERAGGNLRCVTYPEALQPVPRFVDALRSLKARPDDLLLSAITGVPPELVGDPTDVDYEALLDDPRMEVRENPDRPGFLLPACDLEGTGFAVPARRIVEAVRGFGESGVVQSICEPRFDRALRGITDRLGELIRRRAG
ncbi:MAG TPA: hypothetical protein RMH26_30285, partial [Polyangiaceae bacterium LLY-WYZ-15_(1-7)]|nr:hypothetical protein [Polyangiaceae bacterium LLY-WYZ-15_(1-7)]